VIDTFQPQGSELTRVTSDWLFDPKVMAQPIFDPSDAVEILGLVNKQDWEVCELTQKNMASRAFVHGGNYAPDEHHPSGCGVKLNQENLPYKTDMPTGQDHTSPEALLPDACRLNGRSAQRAAHSSVRTPLPNRGTHGGVHLKVLFEKRQYCQSGLDILLIAPHEGR